MYFASVKWWRKIKLFTAFTWTIWESSLFFYSWEGNGYTLHTWHYRGWPNWTMTAITIVSPSSRRALLQQLSSPLACLWLRCISLNCSLLQPCPCSPFPEHPLSRNLGRGCVAQRDTGVQHLSSPCRVLDLPLISGPCHPICAQPLELQPPASSQSLMGSPTIVMLSCPALSFWNR